MRPGSFRGGNAFPRKKACFPAMSPPTSDSSTAAQGGVRWRWLLPLLFLVAVFSPDFSNKIATHGLSSRDPEPAIRHFRDGRNPGLAALMVPLLESDDQRVCIRAAREISRLADPMALPALFDAVLADKLPHKDFLDALTRFRAPQAWLVMEGQLDRLDPALRGEALVATAVLQQNWDHWQVPPRLHSLVAVHEEALGGLTVAVHRWEAP
jgi:hypothetical protein